MSKLIVLIGPLNSDRASSLSFHYDFSRSNWKQRRRDGEIDTLTSRGRHQRLCGVHKCCSRAEELSCDVSYDFYMVNNWRSRAIKFSWWQTGVYVTNESRRQKHLQNGPDTSRHQNLLRFRPLVATQPQTHLITCCRSLWRETWGSSHVCVGGSSDGPLCGIAVESKVCFFSVGRMIRKRRSS